MRTQAILIVGLSVASAAEILARQDSSAACESALAEGEEIFESVPPAPTDEEFLRFMLEQDNMMDARGPCQLPTVTGDPVKVSSYSSFVSQFTSWLTANDDDIRSIYSVCQGNDAFESIVDSIGLPSENGELCTEYSYQTLPPNSAETTPEPTPTPTGPASEETNTVSTTAGNPSTTGASESEESGPAESGEDAAASSGVPTGAAPRQTGMAVAAMAAAGIVVVNMY